ncbi:hypothetical protein [Kribbella catacumbae]|uniref:hypothetical protein n=1 Tax=Kribbella catacumbae TaxID=460086 RepID=UPI00037356A6|nr:hypothetical protein [Kribbella catacumbae]
MLAHTQTVDLHELRTAIAAKQNLSDIDPFGHFDIPADWTRTYSQTAKGVPVAEPFTAKTAAELVATFIDPALDKNSNTATWNPQRLTWSQARNGPGSARENE